MANVFDLSNDTFANFAYFASLVVLKMFVVGLLTVAARVLTGTFTNPEDAEYFTQGKKKATQSDTVERTRRNHLNDLENIPAFVLLGFFYALTGPGPTVALWHFRIFAYGRIMHTLSYQLGLQPWRAVFHVISLGANISMAVQILMATW